MSAPAKAYEADPGKSNVYAEEDDHTDSDGTSRKAFDVETGVRRALTTRQLAMLALGGIIGPGLLVVGLLRAAPSSR
jgi:amino acid permease